MNEKILISVLLYRKLIMQTIKIEVKLDGEELTKEDVSNFVAGLIDKENLQFYSISLHTEGKEPQIEWDCPEL